MVHTSGWLELWASFILFLLICVFWVSVINMHQLFIYLLLFVCLFVLATPHGMQDLSAPNQGLNPCPLQQKCRVLTTGRPEKSCTIFYLKSTSIKRNLELGAHSLCDTTNQTQRPQHLFFGQASHLIKSLVLLAWQDTLSSRMDLPGLPSWRSG